MPRVPFIPGAEALADDLMTVQDSGIIRYSSEAQRDADWPAPFPHALCYIEDALYPLIQVRGPTVWNSMVVGAWSAGRQFIGSTLAPAPNMQPRPRQFEYTVTPSRAAITWRKTAGGPSTDWIAVFRSEPDYTLVRAALDSSTLQHSFMVHPLNSSGGLFTWNIWLPGDDSEKQWMYLGQDSARPTRVKLTVGGNISADNHPVDLMERLQNLEARLAEAEARLAILDAPQLIDDHDPEVIPPVTEYPPESSDDA